MIIFYRILSESPNIRKILLMLEEVGLPYVVELLELNNNGKFDTEFFTINPNGTVPAILDTDTGISIFESGAILYYLAEKSGKLLPSNLQNRAEVVKWLMFEVANMCPTMIELHHYVLNDSGEFPDSIFQRYKSRLTQYCAILDKQLETSEFLGGEYSIADVALYPWTVILEDMADINLNDYPNLTRWATAIDNRSTALDTSQAGS